MAEVKIPKGRPDDLWPLFAGLETLDGVGPKTAKHYKGLGVETPKDLILTLPVGGGWIGQDPHRYVTWPCPAWQRSRW